MDHGILLISYNLNVVESLVMDLNGHMAKFINDEKTKPV